MTPHCCTTCHNPALTSKQLLNTTPWNHRWIKLCSKQHPPNAQHLPTSSQLMCCSTIGTSMFAPGTRWCRLGRGKPHQHTQTRTHHQPRLVLFVTRGDAMHVRGQGERIASMVQHAGVPRSAEKETTSRHAERVLHNTCTPEHGLLIKHHKHGTTIRCP